MKLLDGKKTYLTMLVVIVLAGIDAFNGYCGGLTENAPAICGSAFQVPEFVYAILGALGIYTRSVAKPKA